MNFKEILKSVALYSTVIAVPVVTNLYVVSKTELLGGKQEVVHNFEYKGKVSSVVKTDVNYWPIDHYHIRSPDGLRLTDGEITMDNGDKIKVWNSNLGGGYKIKK